METIVVIVIEDIDDFWGLILNFKPFFKFFGKAVDFVQEIC